MQFKAPSLISARILAVFVMPWALALLSSPATSVELPFARVNETAGQATLDGTPLKVGTEITSDGLIETGPGGKAKIELIPSRSMLILGSGARLRLRRPGASGDQEHELIDGIARLNVPKAAGKPDSATHRPVFKIRSNAAVMGVRGTQFMAVSNPLLGESELVVFEGTVELVSLLDPKDQKQVTQGHWGGVGGRFGKQIGPLIQLPQKALLGFDQLSAGK